MQCGVLILYNKNVQLENTYLHCQKATMLIRAAFLSLYQHQKLPIFGYIQRIGMRKKTFLNFRQFSAYKSVLSTRMRHQNGDFIILFTNAFILA